jgi:hypothetical protein
MPTNQGESRSQSSDGLRLQDMEGGIVTRTPASRNYTPCLGASAHGFETRKITTMTNMTTTGMRLS